MYILPTIHILKSYT